MNKCLYFLIIVVYFISCSQKNTERYNWFTETQKFEGTFNTNLYSKKQIEGAYYFMTLPRDTERKNILEKEIPNTLFWQKLKHDKIAKSNYIENDNKESEEFKKLFISITSERYY